MSEQTQAPQGRLSFKAAGDVIGKRHDLESRPENELARVQDERLITFGLNQPSQVWLFHTRIDVRVLVVLEDPKPAVQPHVDAGRLDHPLVVGINLHPVGGDLSLNVPVTQKHGARLLAQEGERARTSPTHTCG